jgi:hypothetical protein
MANITVQQYQPSEIIAIFNDILAQQNNKASGKIVCIRGLFLKGNGVAYNGVYYDSLRDENSPVELPIRITEAQRKELTAGNLVDILGTLGRRITSKSEIKLELNVSRVEVVKEQVIDENEVKRIEYRQRKVEKGFQNVDGVLESLLFSETRPQIALVIAATTITKGDFEDGIRAARASIDFHEERVSALPNQPVATGQRTPHHLAQFLLSVAHQACPFQHAQPFTHLFHCFLCTFLHICFFAKVHLSSTATKQPPFFFCDTPKIGLHSVLFYETAHFFHVASKKAYRSDSFCPSIFITLHHVPWKPHGKISVRNTPWTKRI